MPRNEESPESVVAAELAHERRGDPRVEDRLVVGELGVGDDRARVVAVLDHVLAGARVDEAVPHQRKASVRENRCSPPGRRGWPKARRTEPKAHGCRCARAETPRSSVRAPPRDDRDRRGIAPCPTTMRRCMPERPFNAWSDAPSAAKPLRRGESRRTAAWPTGSPRRRRRARRHALADRERPGAAGRQAGGGQSGDAPPRSPSPRRLPAAKSGPAAAKQLKRDCVRSWPRSRA